MQRTPDDVVQIMEVSTTTPIIVIFSVIMEPNYLVGTLSAQNNNRRNNMETGVLVIIVIACIGLLYYISTVRDRLNSYRQSDYHYPIKFCLLYTSDAADE